MENQTPTESKASSNNGLALYALIYNIITIYFIYDIKRDESASLGYIYIFPIFWMIGILLLALFFFFKKWRVVTFRDYICFIASTPVPLILFLIFYFKTQNINLQ